MGRAGSDVANMRDVDEDLPTIKEEEQKTERKDGGGLVEPQAAGLHSETRPVDASSSESKNNGGLLYLALAFLLLALATAFWPAANEMALSNSSQQERFYSESIPLEPALGALLKADEFGKDEVTRALLDMPFEKDEKTPKKQLEQQAETEANRILSATKENDILGCGPISEQQREFQRIVKLLHPDKGLVSASDKRANTALRLAFAARRRALKQQ